MIIIGLTGNIGVGKSTVLDYLACKGALTVDADKLAHQVMQPGMPAYQPVVAGFGPAVVLPTGEINRQALGAIVFENPERLRQLEGIVHPAVFALAKDILARSTKPVAILEAIKLLESHRLVTLCREIWVVTASLDAQLARLMQSRGMSEVAANARLAAQSSQDEKVRQATRVIVNNGSLADLHAQLDAIWHDLLARYGTELANYRAEEQ